MGATGPVPAALARWLRRSLHAARALAWLGCCIAAPAGAAAESGIVVSVDGAVLTVRVREAPVEEVLAEIGRQLGVRMVLIGEFAEIYSGQIVATPLPEALDHITAGAAIVLIHAPPADGAKAGAIEEVRLYRHAIDRGRPVVTAQPNVLASPGTRPDGSRPAARRPSTAPALEDYAGASPARRMDAVRTLASVGDEAAVAALGDILREDPDAEVRQVALAALRRIGGEETASAIEQGLGDADRGTRAAVIAALGESGTERSVASLGQVLFGDSDGELRLLAVSLLAERQSEGARALLEAATEDPDEWVREAANQSLGLR